MVGIRGSDAETSPIVGIGWSIPCDLEADDGGANAAPQRGRRANGSGSVLDKCRVGTTYLDCFLPDPGETHLQDPR